MASATQNRSLTRRNLLTAGAAAATAAMLPRFSAYAAAPAVRVIDFHHHFNPPFLVNAAAGNRVGAGDAAGLNWDLSWSLEDMDKTGIGKAVLLPPTGL